MNIDEKFEKDLKEIKDKLTQETLREDFIQAMVKILKEELNDTK